MLAPLACSLCIAAPYLTVLKRAHCSGRQASQDSKAVYGRQTAISPGRHHIWHRWNKDAVCCLAITTSWHCPAQAQAAASVHSTAADWDQQRQAALCTCQFLAAALAGALWHSRRQAGRPAAPMFTCHSLANSTTAEVQDLLPPLVVKEEVERPDVAILSCSASSTPRQVHCVLQSVYLRQLDAGRATAQEDPTATGMGDTVPSKATQPLTKRVAVKLCLVAVHSTVPEPLYRLHMQQSSCFPGAQQRQPAEGLMLWSFCTTLFVLLRAIWGHSTSEESSEHGLTGQQRQALSLS